jgi:hypothetical protein
VRVDENNHLSRGTSVAQRPIAWFLETSHVPSNITHAGCVLVIVLIVTFASLAWPQAAQAQGRHRAGAMAGRPVIVGGGFYPYPFFGGSAW